MEERMANSGLGHWDKMSNSRWNPRMGCGERPPVRSKGQRSTSYRSQFSPSLVQKGKDTVRREGVIPSGSTANEDVCREED